jgi:ABC-type phosphonate transport system ATPase subunit
MTTLGTAVSVSAKLQDLHDDLARRGQHLDASIVHHCGEVIADLIGRLVVSQPQQEARQS